MVSEYPVDDMHGTDSLNGSVTVAEGSPPFSTQFSVIGIIPRLERLLVLRKVDVASFECPLEPFLQSDRGVTAVLIDVDDRRKGSRGG